MKSSTNLKNSNSNVSTMISETIKSKTAVAVFDKKGSLRHHEKLGQFPC